MQNKVALFVRIGGSRHTGQAAPPQRNIQLEVSMDKETKELRLAQWAGIIKEQKQSGLTVKTWCSQNGITKDAYYYWQQKLRKEI